MSEAEAKKTTLPAQAQARQPGREKPMHPKPQSEARHYKAAGKLNLATSLLLRGVAAIIEAYLIYWAVVYFVARKWFGFNREWAAPLASGISICGVSAAIATGGAIRARRSCQCWFPRSWSCSP